VSRKVTFALVLAGLSVGVFVVGVLTVAG